MTQESPQEEPRSSRERPPRQQGGKRDARAKAIAAEQARRARGEAAPKKSQERDPQKEREAALEMIRAAGSPEEAREIFETFKDASDLKLSDADFESMVKERAGETGSEESHQEPEEIPE